MFINFHGVRGSHPVADSEMAKFGGNTSCVEIVKTNKKGIKIPIIIDSGSGIIKYGYFLAGKMAAGEYSKTFPMLFTHLHSDHVEGFNFFQPVYFSFCTMHLLGMESPHWNTETVLRNRIASPAFPVDYRNMKCRLVHRCLSDGEIIYIDQNGEPQDETGEPLFEIRIMQAFAPSHPQQGALYYRISDPDDGSSIACIWDNESHIGGDVRVINFAHNADVMIHDTQYTEEEYANGKVPVQGFGHSTYAMAVENTKKSGTKNLIAFHYNPRHTDRILKGIARKHVKHPFGFYMSYEGLSLTLEKGKLSQNEDMQLGFAKDNE